MAPKSPFPKEECVQIVGWWYELKDLEKVHWKYTKLKGNKKHPRKLPKKNVFRSVIDRFNNIGSIKIEFLSIQSLANVMRQRRRKTLKKFGPW